MIDQIYENLFNNDFIYYNCTQVKETKLIKLKQYIIPLYSIVKVILGNIVLSLAYAKLMIPHNIINGGVTSLSMIISKWINIHISTLTNIITIILLIVCWFFLGKASVLKSFFGSIFYLLFFNLFFNLNFNISINFFVDFILAILFIAFGYYCCLSEGATTVGLDIIALIINKNSKKLSVAILIRDINYLVLVLGLFTFGIKSVVVGILFSYCYSFLLSKLIDS